MTNLIIPQSYVDNLIELYQERAENPIRYSLEEIACFEGFVERLQIMSDSHKENEFNTVNN